MRTYQSRVFGVAYHLLGNSDDARDLTQEVFVRVYENLSACASADYFLPWVFRVTRNACIDFQRRRNARPKPDGIRPEEMFSLADQADTPQEVLQRKRRQGLIYRALQSMSALNREIILLKEIQELTLEEISVMLAVPVGTLKSRSHRARIELAQEVLRLESAENA